MKKSQNKRESGKKIKSLLICLLAAVSSVAVCFSVACENPDEPSNTITTPTDEVKVTISQTSLNVDLAEKTSVTLTATASDDSAIVWSSSNEEIATVDGGVVTLKKTGTVTITATSGEAKAECVITVTDTTEEPPEPPVDEEVTVTISETVLNVDLYERQSVTLTATASDDSAIVWSSSNEEIATVDGGVVTLLKEGTVTITATSGEAKAECVITVTDSTPAPQNDYDIEKISTENGRFETYRKYIAEGTDGTNNYNPDTWYILAYSGTAVEYYTSAVYKTQSNTVSVAYNDNRESGNARDNYICLMPSDGAGLYKISFGLTLTGEGYPDILCGNQTISAGNNLTAEITVTDSSPVYFRFTAEAGSDFTIEISDIQIEKLPDPVTVTISDTALSVDLSKGTVTLTATASDDSAIVWSSSAEEIATVDGGVVTLLKEGTVIITAASGDSSAYCTINIADGVISFGNNATAVANSGRWYYWYDTNAISNDPVSVAKRDSQSGNLTVIMGTASKTVQLKYQPEYEVGTFYSVTFTITAPEGATYNVSKSGYGTDGSGLTAIGNGQTTFTYYGTVDSTHPFIITYNVDKTGDVVISDILFSEIANPVTVTLNETGFSADIAEQQSITLTATASDNGGVVWTSSNDEVATVSQDGVVTLLKAGTATITATSENAVYASASCVITVTDSSAVEPPEPDPVSYDITVLSSGAALSTARKNFASGDIKDEWVIYTYNNTTKTYITDAKFNDGEITFRHNSGSSEIGTSTDQYKYYLCYMPEDATKTYTLTYTLTVSADEGAEVSEYAVTKNTNISAGEPIYIYFSKLASTGCTVTISDIVITEA